MRILNIQLFASIWDENIENYNNSINQAQSQLDNLDNEKNQLLNDYNDNYNNELSKYENLMEEQEKNLDTWKEEQEKQLEAQKNYEIGLIEQNKADAQKKTDAELGDAYIDYVKGLNQFGGAAEAMASSGLAGSGFAKNSQIAMNITYQNRVSTAKAALLKANTQYDNDILKAILNNDAALAEIAYQHMQQSYQLALQGFEYRENLFNNKLAYEKDINDTYFARQQELQDDINYYNSRLDYINEKQREQEEWERTFAAQQEQWEKEFAETQRQFNASYNASVYSYGDNGSYAYGDSTGTTQQTAEDDYAYAKRVFGNNANTYNKKDYYFDNGYQPRYYENKKLNTTGVKVKEVFGNSLGAKVGEQNIWHAGGKYYVWIGETREYMELDEGYVKKLKNAASWWDSLWHKGI